MSRSACVTGWIYVVLTYAIAKIGAVKVPVNAGVRTGEFQYYLETADAVLLITDKEVCPRMLRGTKVRQVIFLGENATKDLEYVPWKELAEGSCASYEEWADQTSQNGELLSDIVFTSGSTERPKAIMIHHDMLLRSAYGTCYTRCMETGRRIYLPIPFYHMFAYVEGLLASMLVGGSIVITTKRFDAHKALEMVRRHRVNDIVCVSYIMMKLLDKGRPQAVDYPQMHACYFASSCPDDTWQRARDAFGITDVSTGYGMSECGSTTAMIAPDDSPEKVSMCHGRAKKAGKLEGTNSQGALLDIKIRDSVTGETLPPGEVGEICCKGVTLMHGYYHNDTANGQNFDNEGWFFTGDLGCMSTDGYLEYLGRCDDTYKINGENVSPFYLDRVIGQCEDVKVVETVGVTSPKYGEVGVAFVESDEETEEVKRRIISYCEAHLARFQIPKYIIFGNHEQWPLTDTGKIKKRELRKMAEKMLKVE